MVKAELGAGVIGFRSERMLHSDGPGDNVNLLLLVFTLRGVDRKRRHELNKRVLCYLADSPSYTVRKHLTVNFR